MAQAQQTGMQLSDWFSLVGVIISFLSFVLAAWAAGRAWVTRNDGKKLQKLNEQVAQLKLIRSANLILAIDHIPGTYAAGKTKPKLYRARIKNIGNGEARNVRIIFRYDPSAGVIPLPLRGNTIVENEQDKAIFIEIIAQGMDYTIDFFADVLYAPEYKVAMLWDNPNGDPETRETIAKLPGLELPKFA